MPNRLAAESSPYLLQHAGNPVDWYPWGDAAFDLARQTRRPIFLSVGYSTCHWCHVMERESFENAEIAAILNTHYVPIKVDREERPDVDRVYMAFVQATTGAGGWPMSVWLTPELQPFFGGTYFPPFSRWGRPGFSDVLIEIARAWRADPGRVERSAADVIAHLDASIGIGASRAARAGDSPAVADASSLSRGVAEFRRAFDSSHAGFGGAPKFPRPAELLFLLAESARSGDAEPRQLALATLRAMARGGVRDHLGGGFHRYSVDAAWRVPHFEKMLYDQAQLVLAYLEAAQAAGDAALADVAGDTLDYVRRELTDRGGGFYSAEDADSVPPEHAGHPGAHPSEGAFYLWTTTESDALTGADAEVVRQRFGFTPNGNAPNDPQGEFVDRNIPFLARSVDEIARATGRSIEDVSQSLFRARRVLFEARADRPRPSLDDKILAAWNGLMVAAFARAARVWPSAPRAAGDLLAAQRAARFALETLWDSAPRTLRRRYRSGQVGIDAFAEDYASLIFGLLELVQADGDPAWLDAALMLQARQDELFWDEAEGGWFSTTGGDPSVLLRLKEDYDGAEPSANSLSVMNHLVIAHLTGSPDSSARAERALARLGPRLGDMARAVPTMARALSAWHAGMTQVVIVGDPTRDDTGRLLATAARQYLPFAVVLPVQPGDRQAVLARRMPWIREMALRGGQAAAYVCRHFSCEQPVTTPEDLSGLLGRA